LVEDLLCPLGSRPPLWISRPLRLFYLVFKPAIWLLNGLANWLLKRILRLDPVAESELAHREEELRLILDESAKASKISKVSQEIVANAFEIHRRLVREVMTSRGEVVYLASGLSFRDNLQRVKTARHTRSNPGNRNEDDRTLHTVKQRSSKTTPIKTTRTSSLR
jgi:CBS domain containing-hemolysin-like protein